MHSRRLTLTTFALPFVFAACSNDRNDTGDVPVFTESMPNQGMNGAPPSGSNEMAGGTNQTPSTPSGSANGNAESPNQVTGLQQPVAGPQTGGAAPDGTGT